MNPLPSSPSRRISRPVAAESADRSRPPRPGDRPGRRRGPSSPPWSRTTRTCSSGTRSACWGACRTPRTSSRTSSSRCSRPAGSDEVASIRAYLYRSRRQRLHRPPALADAHRPVAASRSTSIGSRPAPTARPSPHRPSRNPPGSRPCSVACRASRPRRSGCASSTGCGWTRSPRSWIARPTPSAPACATASRSCARRSDGKEQTDELP